MIPGALFFGLVDCQGLEVVVSIADVLLGEVVRIWQGSSICNGSHSTSNVCGEDQEGGINVLGPITEYLEDETTLVVGPEDAVEWSWVVMSARRSRHFFVEYPTSSHA